MCQALFERTSLVTALQVLSLPETKALHCTSAVAVSFLHDVHCSLLIPMFCCCTGFSQTQDFQAGAVFWYFRYCALCARKAA